jgi:hypothetical protein
MGYGVLGGRDGAGDSLGLSEGNCSVVQPVKMGGRDPIAHKKGSLGRRPQPAAQKGPDHPWPRGRAAYEEDWNGTRGNSSLQEVVA